MRRLLVIPLGLILMLAGALVWSGGTAHQRADFAFINRGDIITLDINQMSYMQDFRLTYGIREGLYSPDPKTYKPIPAGAIGYDYASRFDFQVRAGGFCATPWLPSPQKLKASPAVKVIERPSYTFHLRKEAKWSNGDPATAHDYVFSWKRMLEDPGEYTYLFYYFRNAREYEKSVTDGTPFDLSTLGIRAIDDYTLRVDLEAPVPYLLELLAFPPFYPRNERSMAAFRQEIFDEEKKITRIVYDAAYTRPPYVVTNGPYELKQWDFKVRLILEKSPTYWDRDQVKTNRVEMVVSDNKLNQFLLYKNKEVDWLADVDADQAAELRKQGRTDLQTSPAFGTAFLTLMIRPNLPASAGGKKNPLADIRVRQALSMAIDRDFIVKHITRMGELPARTYLPPDGTLPEFTWLPGPYDAGRTKPYQFKELQALLPDTKSQAGPGLPYNPKEARRLLAEAGYENGKGFPNLPILYQSTSTVRSKYAQAVKDQWKRELNIEVDAQGIEGKVFKERVSKKNYVIATTGWFGDYPDITTFTDKYLADSLQNDSDWQSAKFDELCAKSKVESDPAARVAMLAEAEHMIDTEVPIIPLFHEVNISMVRPGIDGVAPNPRGLTIFKGLRVRGK